MLHAQNFLKAFYLYSMIVKLKLIFSSTVNISMGMLTFILPQVQCSKANNYFLL